MALNFNSSCFYSIRHINSGKFLYELVVNDTHLAAFGNVTEAGEAGLFQFNEVGLEIITVRSKISKLVLTHLNAQNFNNILYDTTGIVHDTGFSQIIQNTVSINEAQIFHLFVATYVSDTYITSTINGFGYNLMYNTNYIGEVNMSSVQQYTKAVFATYISKTNEDEFNVTEQCSCPTNGSECFPSTTPFRIVQLAHFHNDDYSDAADFGLLGVLSLTGMLMLWH